MNEQTGTCVQWIRTYGFIEDDRDGRRYFVHHTNIAAEDGEFRQFSVGEKVAFTIGTNATDGRRQAINARKWS
jgi:cold shock CspA family protein